MTYVGKTLVFFNLIFSIIVGAFAVLSYSASSNHAAGFKELESRYKVLGATADAYKAENDHLRDQAQTFRSEIVKRGIKQADGKTDIDLKAGEDAGVVAKRVLSVLDARDSQINALKGELTNVRKQFSDLKSGRSTDKNLADKTTEAIQRREKEVKDMRVALEKLGTKNGELSRDLSTEKDQRVQAELEANTLREQNRTLDTNYRDLLRELARTRTTMTAQGPSPRGGAPSVGGPATGARASRSRDNPPLDNVEGSVTRVSGDLVTISIGSDSGLSTGNTLQVFRLGTSPKYIGKIKLVQVDPKQAVGQIQGRPSTPIRAKDRVGSSILGGY